MKFRLCLGLLLVTTTAICENWPYFRGPSRQGVSSETGLPPEWSGTENIAWKTPIPGQGWSSPIVWEDHVFLTTAAEEGASARIVAIHRSDGRILWNREVLRQDTKKKRERNSYATPTPATDGERVYAVFGDGSIVAVDFDGNTVWTYREIEHFSEHGLGASPVLYEDLLIMTYDGSSPDEQKVGWKIPWEGAVILALDKKTGEERWRGKRGLSRIAHVTANVLEEDGITQLVSAAGDRIQGFDIKTGELLWSAYAQGEGVVPAVVLGDRLVYTSSGFEQSTIMAVRPNGRGDVTDSHVAWRQTKGVPRIPSFLYRKPYLYTVTEAGIAMCLQAETGEIVWQQRIGGDHSASPIGADGLIYFLSDEGGTTIIKEGSEFEVVARNSLGEPCQASIAVSQGQLFIRSTEHLFCIGAPRKQ